MELPDINVLIALFDPLHLHHEPAQRWFATAQASAWVTCPITENGFIRIISNPSYANLHLSVAQVAAGLRALIAVIAHLPVRKSYRA